MQLTTTAKRTLFSTALSILIYTLLVILWGAWVRISHSGDGCGDTWPLCQGVLIPEGQRTKTWIEYTHRLMSGTYGLVVFWLYLKLRKYPNTEIQKAAKYILIFTITEALLGAKLVLFGLVASNDSIWRALVMALHLTNSFLLVSWTSRLLWEASPKPLADQNIKTPSVHKLLRLARLGFPLALLIIALFGSVAALSNTLFPSDSLLAGWKDDFAQDSHWLVRLRFLHPLIASILIPLLSLSALALYWGSPDGLTRVMLKRWGLGLVFALVFGYLTLFSLSPVWMKLSHLFIAYLLWIGSLLIRFRVSESLNLSK